MALYYLNGISERWENIIKTSKLIISELNTINGISISSLENGTNIFNLILTEGIDLKELATYLYEKHNIWLGRANEKGVIKFAINESLITRDHTDIISAFKKGIEYARK